MAKKHIPVMEIDHQVTSGSMKYMECVYAIRCELVCGSDKWLGAYETLGEDYHYISDSFIGALTFPTEDACNEIIKIFKVYTGTNCTRLRKSVKNIYPVKVCISIKE